VKRDRMKVDPFAFGISDTGYSATSKNAAETDGVGGNFSNGKLLTAKRFALPTILFGGLGKWSGF
jgi:hypothetical protein